MPGWPLLVLAAALGAWLLWSGLAWLRRLRLARMRRLGRDGEAIAADLLAAAGYRIRDRQCERAARMVVDGEAIDYVVRADYEVERGGRRWVAEVKAGEAVCDPRHRGTRRQLLEYRVVYPEMAGVLLVDVPARRIREVVFPGVGAPPAVPRPGWRSVLVAALLGTLIGAALTAWAWHAVAAHAAGAGAGRQVPRLRSATGSAASRRRRPCRRGAWSRRSRRSARCPR